MLLKQTWMYVKEVFLFNWKIYSRELILTLRNGPDSIPQKLLLHMGLKAQHVLLIPPVPACFIVATQKKVWVHASTLSKKLTYVQQFQVFISNFVSISDPTPDPWYPFYSSTSLILLTYSIPQDGLDIESRNYHHSNFLVLAFEIQKSSWRMFPKIAHLKGWKLWI
jgi:hypothetical protein